ERPLTKIRGDLVWRNIHKNDAPLRSRSKLDIAGDFPVSFSGRLFFAAVAALDAETPAGTLFHRLELNIGNESRTRRKPLQIIFEVAGRHIDGDSAGIGFGLEPFEIADGHYLAFAGRDPH